MIRVSLFIFCTLFFVRFSWRALGNPGSHGFYRFFVFEGLLILILLNHPYWFKNPFSPLQLVSWFLLFTSILFIFQALITLKKHGGYAERKSMPENHSFENTVYVVEQGIYCYARHPMYSSLLLLGWGAFLKHITLLNLCLIVLVSIFLVAAAKVEERENIVFFGKAYEEYMQQTKMFFPWLL
jgi:protein-S-isoprenylcysteine O-methyltransferase Ste14